MLSNIYNFTVQRVYTDVYCIKILRTFLKISIAFQTSEGSFVYRRDTQQRKKGQFIKIIFFFNCNEFIFDMVFVPNAT